MPKTCLFEGCLSKGNRIFLGKWCQGHYIQLKKGRSEETLTPLRRFRSSETVKFRDKFDRKLCNVCGVWKSEKRFWRDKNTADELSGECQECHKDRKYGLPMGGYLNLIDKQDNKCAICFKVFEETPSVDHDHSCCPGRITCGKCIRGLLCSDCNRGLGCFRDNANSLRVAANYLEGKID